MWTCGAARVGTTHSSRAPRVRAFATGAAAAEREPAGARASPPSLLVVDDDASLRLAIASYLTDAGYHVRQAGCATDALAVCLGTSTPASAEPAEPPPSLIVLDVMMPGTDGLELLRRLRAGVNDPEPAVARLATLPVVLLTARGFASDRIKGARAALARARATGLSAEGSGSGSHGMEAGMHGERGEGNARAHARGPVPSPWPRIPSRSPRAARSLVGSATMRFRRRAPVAPCAPSLPF
jgi:CheY-like chemotaxis protein